MTRYLSYVLFSFLLFSSTSSAGLNLSPPPDMRAIESVKLFGSIPARGAVEDFIAENNIDPESVKSLYYNTISNEALKDQHSSTLVGESGNLSILISKETKELIRVFIYGTKA